MSAEYRVTAPLVVVKDDGGSYHHIYQGGSLPANADAEHVKLLAADGMIEKGPATSDGSGTAPVKKSAASKKAAED